jgi:nitroreductase
MKLEIKEAIRTRRSIRKYKNKPVPKKIVAALLEAAGLAPSATNRQPWEFVVVHRSHLDRLDQILSEAFAERVASVGEDIVREAIKDLPIPVDEGGDKLKGLGSFYRTFGGAPVAIVVSVPKDDDPWVWKNYISDASAAIENILLAALDEGLGTCWLTGPLKTRARIIASLLEIGDDREIVGIVALGYPDHHPPMPPKHDITRKTRWLGFD